jgi:hypothetical protein
MLGFAPLGGLALGQLPSDLGVALGDTITLTVTLDAGSARGEIQRPPIFIVLGGGGVVSEPRVRDAIAPGARIDLYVSLLPGRAKGIVTVPGPPPPAAIHGTAPGELIVLSIGIVSSGRADGFDGFAHDNEFLLLAAA